MLYPKVRKYQQNESDQQMFLIHITITSWRLMQSINTTYMYELEFIFSYMLYNIFLFFLQC